MARPLPNRDCQSRSVSRMSSRMTRTAVEPGLVIGSQRARRMGSPRSRIRWIVIYGLPFRSSGQPPETSGGGQIWELPLIQASTSKYRYSSNSYYYIENVLAIICQPTPKDPDY